MSSLKELDLDLGYFMIIFKEFERPNHVIAPTILQISRPRKTTDVRLKSQPTKSWGNDRFRGTMEMSKTYRQ